MKNKLTAEHYSKQWGGELDYQTFVMSNPDAAKLMPGRILPWQQLFDDIRAKASIEPVVVYDAACGFGDLLRHICAEPIPKNLSYVGADIHNALDNIERPNCAVLKEWDITEPIEGRPFDYIVCRAAIHHTPDPEATFNVLAGQLKPGGVIAITAYAKKSPMREAIDDAFRAKIVPMSNEVAFEVANQFTTLGKDLQESNGTVTIKKDLPLLKIKAGTYPIQTFIYNYFIKCWHNSAFPEKYCDLINFDWYHPPFAYRYEVSELRAWAKNNGLNIIKEVSIEAQHFMQCQRLKD